MANLSKEVEMLGAEIADKVYLDVANWHLYLNDAHLHHALAQEALVLMENRNLSEEKVSQILRNLTVTLGGGQLTVSLDQLIPLAVQRDLWELLEEYERSL